MEAMVLPSDASNGIFLVVVVPDLGGSYSSVWDGTLDTKCRYCNDDVVAIGTVVSGKAAALAVLVIVEWSNGATRTDPNEIEPDSVKSSLGAEHSSSGTIKCSLEYPDSVF